MAASSNFEGCTLIITNLPENLANHEFEEFVSNYGPVKRSFLVRNEDGKCRGIGYVTYALREDAEEVLKKNLKFNGLTVRAKEAPARIHKTSVKKKNLNRKEVKKRQRVKRARVIIRNLPFSVTEDDLMKLTSKFGNVIEVTIPRKDDGKARGFAFVGFDRVNSAVKAIKGLNAQKIKDRPIAVDFVVPKEKYQETVEEGEAKEDTTQNDETQHTRKAQKHSTREKNVKLSKKRKSSVSKDDNDDDDENEESEEDLSEDEEDSASENEDVGDLAALKQKHKKHNLKENESDSDDSEVEAKKKKSRKQTSLGDLAEGRTLFVRNLSFNTTEDDFKDAVEKFGPVLYVKLCIDPLTEHPKGTGFIKFQKKEDAEKCLQECSDEAKEGLVVDGRRLIITMAVPRGEIEKIYEEKRKKQHKDKRNLYLAREGLIYAGSSGAEGVSEGDLKKRLVLEVRRRKLLRNLHNFISTTRLCVHNLPPSVDDVQLRRLFLKAVDDRRAKITEARVMRDRETVNRKGLGKSKGFGFVNFTEHEHALKALRHLNNNPDIFTPAKRPIVEFCIENKSALNARQRRLERSKRKLEQLKQQAILNASESKETGGNESSKKQKDGRQLLQGVRGSEEQGKPSYMGSTMKEGVKGFASHMGPKIRHRSRDKRQEMLKNRKKMKKAAKKKSLDSGMKKEQTFLKVKKLKKKKGQKKKNIDKDEARLQQLIKKHRGKVSDQADKRRSKWFSN